MPPAARTDAVEQCPRCRYALTGLAGDTCPECGGPADPASLSRMALRRGRRRRLVISLVVMLGCLYLPYGWLLFVGGDHSYHWTWIRLWPGLPALFPVHLLLLGAPAAIAGIGMYAISLVMLAGCTLYGARGRLALILTAIGVLAVSGVNSWCAYHVYLW